MSVDEQMPLEGEALRETISAEIVDLYSRRYATGHTTATTYIHDDLVLCVVEESLTTGEKAKVAGGGRTGVMRDRLAFQERQEDEFTEAIERLTGRSVVAFLSANQTAPDIATELFFLEPLAEEGEAAA